MDDRNRRRLRSLGIRLPDSRGYGGRSGSQARFSSGAGRSLLTFAELSALLAVLVGLTYVLGLLALYAPIARTYKHDFVTAWYEVALLPKPVVAGHGVKELLGMPSLAVLGLLVSLLIIAFVSGYTRTRFGERAQRYVLWVLILLMIGLAFGIVYRSLKHHHFDVATTLLPEHMPLRFYIPMIVIALLAALVSVRLLQHGLTLVPNSTVPRISKLKYVVGATLVAFADFFFLGLVGAAYEDPPLPSVEIHGSEKVEGALLAHTDRFWYVIDEDGQLVGTPDTHVTSVHVLPKSD